MWARRAPRFLAFARADLSPGRARTPAGSQVTTPAGTLTDRATIALGPGRWGLGPPTATGRILDTQPAAATVGLFTRLAVVRRAPAVFPLTGGSLVRESAAGPSLAGREHPVAVGAATDPGLPAGRTPRPGCRA